MAHMSQEKKVVLAENLKKAMEPFKKKFGLKYSLAVRNHSTIVMTITEGNLDFFENFEEGYDKKHQYMQVNTYRMDSEEAKEHYGAEAQKIFLAAKKALNDGNHDHSDIMTDYFDVGWYVDVNVGRWNKPYKFTGKTEEKEAA
jgi:predicted SnoaL-like aldol condensation-catalyzing enzyme